MQAEPQKWVCTNKDCEHFGEDVVAEGATRVYCVSCREDLALQATVPEDSAKAAKPMSDSLLLEDERRIEEREQKATGGRWWWQVSGRFAISLDARRVAPWSTVIQSSSAGMIISDEDKGFISHARTDIPLLLSRLKAERGKNEWIPVSERLPDDSRLVNVLLCNTVASTGHYNHGKSLWRPWAQFKGELDGVTHWMPLPEPPAAKESHATEPH